MLSSKSAMSAGTDRGNTSSAAKSFLEHSATRRMRSRAALISFFSALELILPRSAKVFVHGIHHHRSRSAL